MEKANFEIRSKMLATAADIAIEAFHKFPPKEFGSDFLKHVFKTYSEFKDNAANPEPKYRNLTSLRYLEADVLTYFQESAGPAVDFFWKRIKEERLEFKRENKLQKILKRNKIVSDVEYNFVIDVIVPYRQEGLIGEEEWSKLNTMIAKFEEKKS